VISFALTRIIDRGEYQSPVSLADRCSRIFNGLYYKSCCTFLGSFDPHSGLSSSTPKDLYLGEYFPVYKPIAMCYRQVNVIKYACKHESPQSDELVNNSMTIRHEIKSAHLIEDTLQSVQLQI
jgi:hypothetical protein